MLEEYGLVPASEMAPALAGAARGVPVTGRVGVRAFAVVDPEDYPMVARSKWHLDDSGRAKRNAVVAEGRRFGTRMHREIMGLEPHDPREVDHINRNPLDNRRSNLRICDHAQNHQNLGSYAGSTSKYRGVSWDAPRGKWKAQATLNYRNVYIGRYDTEQEAADAAAAWREEHMPFTMN